MTMILMLAALAAQTSSPQSDGAMVRCAISKMPRADVTALQRQMVAGVAAGTKPTPATERLLNVLRNGAASCNPGGGQSDLRAADIAITSVAVESLSTALQAKGVNTPAINAKIARTPPTTLDALLAQKRNAQTDAMGKELLAMAKIPTTDQAGSRLLGAYAFNVVRLAKLFASTAPR
ncbi:hypothetical protein [Sphingomonas sp. RS2018]